MKHKYIRPQIHVMEIHLESMLAASTDRIPVGDEVKPSATNRYKNPWDCSNWVYGEHDV